MKEALEAASKKILDACAAVSADLAPHEDQTTTAGRNVIRIRRRLAEKNISHAVLRMEEGLAEIVKAEAEEDEPVVADAGEGVGSVVSSQG